MLLIEKDFLLSTIENQLDKTRVKNNTEKKNFFNRESFYSEI